MAKTIESASPMKTATPISRPTQEEITLRAYEIYLQRSGAPGDEVADWLQAERELMAEIGKPRRKATVKSIAA